MKIIVSRTVDHVGCQIKIVCENPSDEVVHGLLERSQDKLQLSFDWDKDDETGEGAFVIWVAESVESVME